MGNWLRAIKDGANYQFSVFRALVSIDGRVSVLKNRIETLEKTKEDFECLQDCFKDFSSDVEYRLHLLENYKISPV